MSVGVWRKRVREHRIGMQESQTYCLRCGRIVERTKSFGSFSSRFSHCGWSCDKCGMKLWEIRSGDLIWYEYILTDSLHSLMSEEWLWHFLPYGCLLIVDGEPY